MRADIKAIESIELRTDDYEIIWELDTKDRTENFVVGSLYGCLFLLHKNPGYQITILLSKFNNDILYGAHITDVEDIKNFSSVLSELHQNIEAIQINTELINVYQIFLRDVAQEGKANFATVNVDFFQGLFTMLNAANIPYDQVLLHKPIKDGIAYNIQGVNLPHLEEIQ